VGLPARIANQPHPFGDECVACGLEGWKEAKHKVLTDGTQVTVAEGYGNFKGFSLVADGHVEDTLGYTPLGSFRSEEVARRVVSSSELTFKA
jgi:hypothetical protein